jgi:hypothetical protein
MLYHLSGIGGRDSDGGTIQFEKIDLGTQARTPIPLSGDSFPIGNGLTYDSSSGVFFISSEIPNADGPSFAELYSLDPSGVTSLVGSVDAFFGGMGFSYLVPVELMSFSVE